MSLESIRISKEKWRQRNKDKVNARRRALRQEKRAKLLQGKRCLNCQFPLTSKFAGHKGARLYCNNCTQNHFIKVSRHKWNRYYRKKENSVR